MSIRDYVKKIKGVTSKGDIVPEIGLYVIVVLVGVASFGLGRLSVQNVVQDDTVSIVGSVEPYSTGSAAKSGGLAYNNSTGISGGTYVASRNGTKYYPPECSGASRIKDENKIWFNSVSEAENAGFTQSASCAY